MHPGFRSDTLHIRELATPPISLPNVQKICHNMINSYKTHSRSYIKSHCAPASFLAMGREAGKDTKGSGKSESRNEQGR